MCKTCTAELHTQFYGLKTDDLVVVTGGEFHSRPGTVTLGHVVHTNGPTVDGVRRIQIRLTTGALAIVPETDLAEV